MRSAAVVGDVVSPDAVLDQLRQRYTGLVQTTTWGERALRYSPDAEPARGEYFVTLQERDSDTDASSALDVRGAYRLSFVVASERYRAFFGSLPARGTRVDMALHDPLALDTLMPHPLFGWMSWVTVVNPSPATLDRIWPLLDESYALTTRAYADRKA